MTSGQTSTCVCLVVKSPRTALSFAKTILSACTIPKRSLSFSNLLLNLYYNESFCYFYSDSMLMTLGITHECVSPTTVDF